MWWSKNAKLIKVPDGAFERCPNGSLNAGKFGSMQKVPTSFCIFFRDPNVIFGLSSTTLPRNVSPDEKVWVFLFFALWYWATFLFFFFFCAGALDSLGIGVPQRALVARFKEKIVSRAAFFSSLGEFIWKQGSIVYKEQQQNRFSER